MSLKAERLAQQEADEREALAQQNERPSDPVIPSATGWAGECAGWKVGEHQRTKENRVLGIWKCKWCGQTFPEPTGDELNLMRQRASAYQRPMRPSSRRW